MILDSEEYRARIISALFERCMEVFQQPLPPVMRSVHGQNFRFEHADGTHTIFSVDIAFALIQIVRLRPGRVSLVNHSLEWHRANYDVDEAYALTRDMEEPVIWAEQKEGTFVLIDGNHRLRRALLEQRKELRSYLLPCSVTQWCILFRLDARGQEIPLERGVAHERGEVSQVSGTKEG